MVFLFSHERSGIPIVILFKLPAGGLIFVAWLLQVLFLTGVSVLFL